MGFRPPSTETFTIPEEAIFGVSSGIYEPPYIKIASHVGGRDVSDNGNCRDHFRGAPFSFGSFSFGSFSFGRAKENEQLISNTYSPGCIHKLPSEERSFSCLDTRERTKEKVKAGEKMANNFSASLKQIKYVSFPKSTGNEYLFFNASLRNSFNAIFSQALLKPVPNLWISSTTTTHLGGLRRSFARDPAEKFKHGDTGIRNPPNPPLKKGDKGGFLRVRP